jgi:Ca2+-binding EF-hand superfamily protein
MAVHAQEQTAATVALPASSRHPEFSKRDANGDDALSVDEFVASDTDRTVSLTRDFRVFDANGDQLLQPDEFQAIPSLGPEEERGPVADPIVELARARERRVTERFGEWDRDQSGGLSDGEFTAANPISLLPGLESSVFTDWDRDGDGAITAAEVGLVCDLAYGVSVPTGERVRSPTGRVLDLRMYRNLGPDAAWRVSRDAYIRAIGGAEPAERWFSALKALPDDRFSVTDFMTSGHRTDPVSTFLGMDLDFDARLSPEEMRGIPQGWGPAGKDWLPGFDDDGDGAYSLREFQFLPHVNLLATWHGIPDANHDGMLDPGEFRPVPGIELAGLAVEYFRRLDQDQSGTLSLREWSFPTSHPGAKFTQLDLDADGALTREEYVAEGSQPAARLERDYKLFDADADGRMTILEFQTVPYWIPENRRSPIADPVVRLAEQLQGVVKQHWSAWDRDQNGSLNEAEVQATSVASLLPGLSATSFKAWDQPRVDGAVSLEEALLLIEVACGVRARTGERLRTNSGEVPDWRGFRGMDPDGDGRITRREYLNHMKGLPDPISWYRRIVPEDRDDFGIAEFVACPYRTNPVGMFLEMDVNLDAELAPEELTGIPADWGPPAQCWLPGFDDDANGRYSLREFMLIPHVNLYTAWHGAHDADTDGRLTLNEFRFAPDPELAALAADYFGRLDQDHDQSLTLDEWPFATGHPQARFTKLDTEADGGLTEAEFVADGGLPADRMRRDYKVFDHDADGKLTYEEFLGIPYWVREELRTSPPDPIARRASEELAKLDAPWSKWDTNGDGDLSPEEFQIAGFARTLAGLEMTGFFDWDADRDGRLKPTEAARLLDVAWGVRGPTGEFLRSLKTGHVVDWRSFLAMNPDARGRVPREVYIRQRGSEAEAKQWFARLYETAEPTFGVTEFAASNHRTDPVSQFLAMDVDLNGRLSPAEMGTLPVGWGPAGKEWLAGFDDDRDGAYSLTEFRRLPQLNLLANWQSATDRDFNGLLSPHEFQFQRPPVLSMLALDYFQRLDVNQDRQLDLKEWEFTVNLARIPRQLALNSRDRDGDGSLSMEETMGPIARPRPGEPVNVAQESALIRLEETFRLADRNDDGRLDLAELSTDAGLEALAPGSSALSRTVGAPSAPLLQSLGEGDTTLQLYVILGFNLILLLAVGYYLLRSPGPKS